MSLIKNKVISDKLRNAIKPSTVTWLGNGIIDIDGVRTKINDTFIKSITFDDGIIKSITFDDGNLDLNVTTGTINNYSTNIKI